MMSLKLDQKYISIDLSDAKIKARNKELSILLEMSNILSSSTNLNGLLLNALSKTMEYFGLEAGRIYLLDDGGELLRLAVNLGTDSAGLEIVHIDEGFSGKAARTKSFIAQHVSELEDKKRASLLLKKGLKYIICIPLISMEKVGGVINLATGKTFDLNQGKIDLLTAMGNQIAIAANNAKLQENLLEKIKTLKEKKNLIKFFAYSVSHDLKSPATSIFALTKRLQEKYAEALDEKGKAYCDQIMNTAELMVTLVDKMNAYIQTKEAPLIIENLKISEILASLQNKNAEMLKKRSIKWAAPEILPEIYADKLSLMRVFQNLMENSTKYGGESLGNIRIEYDADDTHHIFSFSDDGIGIKEKDQERIFEIFQRHKNSAGIAGSGLGLAIVKEIAARHGGRVWMESGKPKGVTFYISILKKLPSLVC
ncbi:ATP-binding protein [Thermodesulfobacteriota bacterium]